MTYCTTELQQRGVDPEIIEWRRWRRAQKLTLKDAAGLLEISPEWLHRLEVGGHAKRATRVRKKMSELRARYLPTMRPTRVDGRGQHKRNRDAAIGGTITGTQQS